MSKRKYGKCLWCGRTTDVTNSNRELCETCSQYPSQRDMEYAENQKKLDYLFKKKLEVIQFDYGAEDYRKKHEKPCSTCKYLEECPEATERLHPAKRLCMNIIQIQTKPED